MKQHKNYITLCLLFAVLLSVGFNFKRTVPLGDLIWGIRDILRMLGQIGHLKKYVVEFGGYVSERAIQVMT
jgi:hypothetical protein